MKKLKVEFLGHIVSAQGVEVDPEKVEKVVNWPVPQNLTDVQSFLGLCAYYRRFILDFSPCGEAPDHALRERCDLQLNGLAPNKLPLSSSKDWPTKEMTVPISWTLTPLM